MLAYFLGTLYFGIYTAVYLWPVFLIYLGAKYFSGFIEIPGIISDIFSFLGAVVVLAGLALAGYRSYIAAECHSNENMNIYQAHEYSGAMVLVLLANIPGISKYFKKSSEDRLKNRTR